MAVPANKKSDFAIRSERAALIRELKRIIRENKQFDDSLFVLKTRIPELNKQFNKYVKGLEKPLLRFFVASDTVDDLVVEAQKDFLKSLESFDVDAHIKSRDTLVNAVRRELNTQVNNIIDELTGRQKSKMLRFKAMADQFTVRASELGGKIARGLRIINGQVIDINEATRLWDFFNKNFGTYQTVRFRGSLARPNGVKFPIDAWASQRSITISGEINRITTSLEAANNRIYTGKVSTHGAADSCKFHEGEIIFFSERARQEFKKEFPEIGVSKFKTLQDLNNDRTHIFGPNCKHIVRPFPLQAMSPKRRETEVKENPQPKIPKKINERKIIEQSEKEQS